MAPTIPEPTKDKMLFGTNINMTVYPARPLSAVYYSNGSKVTLSITSERINSSIDCREAVLANRQVGDVIVQAQAACGGSVRQEDVLVDDRFYENTEARRKLLAKAIRYFNKAAGEVGDITGRSALRAIWTLLRLDELVETSKEG